MSNELTIAEHFLVMLTGDVKELRLTGEDRLPEKGEWFVSTLSGEVHQAVFDFNKWTGGSSQDVLPIVEVIYE